MQHIFLENVLLEITITAIIIVIIIHSNSSLFDISRL